MAYLYYSMSRVSAKTRRRILVLLWILGPVVVLPVLIEYGQAALGYDASWFDTWLHPMDSEHYLVSGLYTVMWGLALYLFGMVVADEAMQMRDYDRETYRNATSPFGMVSQLMLICQTGGILVTLLGLLKLAVAVEKLFAA